MSELSSLALIGVLTVASPASAQWSVGAFLGDAATAPARFDVRSLAHETSLVVEKVHLDARSFRSPVYYGGRITRELERVRWLGLEAEFIHAKTIADPTRLVRIHGRLNGSTVDGQQPLAAILPRFELSHGLNFVLGNVVLHWPPARQCDETRTEIGGRLGLGATIPHVEASFRSQDEDGYQLGRMALAGAIGARIRLANRLSAIIELKVTRTRQHVRVGSADVEGVFATRHLVAGLTWRMTRAGHPLLIQ